jgi:hypothetical protein
MDFSSISASQVQQILGISILQSAQATQAAQTVVMMESLQQTQANLAPHPTLGKNLDVSV